jgi:O-antigen ligase
LWLLAEMGLVGFAAFVAPAAMVFWNEWHSARREASAAAAVLGMVAFMVMCGPADMIYQRTFWLLLGATLCAGGLTSKCSPNSEKRASVKDTGGAQIAQRQIARQEL